MQVVDKGLILRETPYKEADVMLNILTESAGKISVLARGARRKGSKFSAAIALLTYSEFTLYESNGRYTLNEAEPVELFYNIRNDLQKLSLASYFAEALERAADEDAVNPELLRLGLNSLYALAHTSISVEKIKTVFELKLAVLSGYMPNVYSCICCDDEEDISFFDIRNGGVVCERCNNGGNKPVDASVIDAMRYIIAADMKKIFSFEISDSSMRKLSEITDEYLSVHFGKVFKTNLFYKSLF